MGSYWDLFKNFRVATLSNSSEMLVWEAANYPVGIYLLKVNNRNGRIRCEICSKLTIKMQMPAGFRYSEK